MVWSPVGRMVPPAGTALVERRIRAAFEAIEHPGIAVGDVIAVLAVNGHAIAFVQIARAGKLIVINIGAIIAAAGPLPASGAGSTAQVIARSRLAQGAGRVDKIAAVDRETICGESDNR